MNTESESEIPLYLKKIVLADKDLNKCHYCNCKTSPLCTINGSICHDCFDVWAFKHKRFDTHNLSCIGFCLDEPDHEPDKSKEYTPKRPKIELIPIPGDGDCLYTCISKALPTKISVKDLRKLVANHQTEETFNNYKNSFPEEFKFETLMQFKNFIKRTGEENGTGNCMWGDENAMQIISNEFLLHIVIFNRKGDFIQSIEPEFDPEEEIPRRYAKRYILLMLDNETANCEHYSLLKFDRKRLISETVWEYFLKVAQGN
jgi:hypothetical protein